MASTSTILYLHGLASSPRGRKRAVLEDRFGPDRIEVVAPDLNVPTFRGLNFVEMVEAARAACDRAEPRVIVGSSLGALVALSLSRILGSLSCPLVLVAPALGFHERWKEKLPESDEFDLFHHGEERPLPIHRRFFEEMALVRVDDDPPPVPVSIVMGTDDETVPYAQVADAWARWEASGRLAEGSRFHRVAGGDHGLVAHGDTIESAVRERLAG
ncbi:MAG TPA: YqiA/YcfP family alpha/beta fold hydrolase [Thermoanaerobaculia bacterium]